MMNDRELDDSLLNEYFNQEIVAPSHLVQNTILRIRKRDSFRLFMIMMAFICSMVFIGLFICLFMGPIPLIFKLGLMYLYCLVQVTVVVWMLCSNYYLRDELTL
jgi:hypothetical protein